MSDKFYQDRLALRPREMPTASRLAEAMEEAITDLANNDFRFDSVTADEAYRIALAALRALTAASYTVVPAASTEALLRELEEVRKRLQDARKGESG